MLRAARILGWFLAIGFLMILGAAVALFFSRNSQWVALQWPYPRLSLSQPFGTYHFEMILGVAAAGWTVALFLAGVALVVFPLYLRRTRQYLATIRKLEKELVELRNLPFRAPAPLEDLPDEPVREKEYDPLDPGDLLQEESQSR